MTIYIGIVNGNMVYTGSDFQEARRIAKKKMKNSGARGRVETWMEKKLIGTDIICGVEKAELITGEQFENLDHALIKEFNDLTYQLNREVSRFSQEEILSKFNRIKELNLLLGVEGQAQLSLF